MILIHCGLYRFLVPDTIVARRLIKDHDKRVLKWCKTRKKGEEREWETDLEKLISTLTAVPDDQYLVECTACYDAP
jgi:hypothetical protein